MAISRPITQRAKPASRCLTRWSDGAVALRFRTVLRRTTHKMNYVIAKSARAQRIAWTLDNLHVFTLLVNLYLLPLALGYIAANDMSLFCNNS